MKKLVCDCCGKDIGIIHSEVDDLALSRLTKFDNCANNTFDLCDQCTKDVIDFIKYRPLWSKEEE